jgi:hypothetical protein
MSPGKKTLAGFAPGPGTYHSPSTKIEMSNVKEVRVASGVDINRDHIIYFKWKLGPDEMGR